ncbi:unnamed protein product [Owenia fusiformis]|uniref:F5/8 type C domain-containing protein n=1 Tax=Owenia fusiformis TaxID=6347 RepID=A0A8S4NN43_OWEFU|nr:unnamed protein product [Owenia fusiformis]
MFRILIIAGPLINTDGLLCPVGYNLVRDIQVVDSENLTWSEAAMECTRRNGRILKVMDNESGQNAKDAMEKHLEGKAWVEYNGEVEDMSDPLQFRESFYIMEHISDEQFDASSQSWDAKNARINSSTAWRPQYADLCQSWVEVDLRKTMCIYGIVTKGQMDKNRWITVYKLLSKTDFDKNFHILSDGGKEELTANDDNDTSVYRNFTKPFNARFIRLYPQEWIGYPAIRFDLLVSNNSCPCRKCPAIMNTPTGTVTIQYESCCSKLPYICETESCDQDKTTDNPSANLGICSCALCSTSLTIGLIIGMVLFMILSIILLILLILSHRKQKNSQTISKSTNPHEIDKNKNEVNQNVAKVSQNVSMTDPKHLYTQVDVRTKRKKSEMTYANTVAYNAAYDTTTDDTTTKDTATYNTTANDTATYNTTANDTATYNTTANDTATYNTTTNDTATYNTTSDDAKGTTLDHTPVDVNVDNVKKHKDDHDIPDGMEMFDNELYADV